jgi:hypothetical protein
MWDLDRPVLHPEMHLLHPAIAMALQKETLLAEELDMRSMWNTASECLRFLSPCVITRTKNGDGCNFPGRRGRMGKFPFSPKCQPSDSKNTRTTGNNPPYERRAKHLIYAACLENCSRPHLLHEKRGAGHDPAPPATAELSTKKYDEVSGPVSIIRDRTENL